MIGNGTSLSHALLALYRQIQPSSQQHTPVSHWMSFICCSPSSPPSCPDLETDVMQRVMLSFTHLHSFLKFCNYIAAHTSTTEMICMFQSQPQKTVIYQFTVFKSCCFLVVYLVVTVHHMEQNPNRMPHLYWQFPPQDKMSL